MMQAQRVVVVDGSRLVRDFLHRAIEKIPEFEVVKELNHWKDLPGVLKQFNADWVFVVISQGEDLSEELTYELLLARPTLHIVAFWIDGSHVKVEWLGRQERHFTGETLNKLAALLESKLWATSSASTD